MAEAKRKGRYRRCWLCRATGRDMRRVQLASPSGQIAWRCRDEKACKAYSLKRMMNGPAIPF